MTPEFKEFAKVPRFYRDIIVTEKIDGTNASVSVGVLTAQEIENSDAGLDVSDPTVLATSRDDSSDSLLVLRAGSRTRWLTRAADNFGFAKWVQENAGGLFQLGDGTHYGEWWGSGIQRAYGLRDGDKRFSLFNTGRWFDPAQHAGAVNDPEGLGREPVPDVPALTVVPVLYRGPLIGANGDAIGETLRRLRYSGSVAVRGFANPEGVMVYHEALRGYFKATLDGDGHKGAT